ncbi:MAG TPA: hypothetical protein PK668_07805 [Myxococcota bacterium]|nr:hypothetical protein [Myxococcota bacterium]HRY93122.1 hypothetical protein [Myxococcota bacterium]
MSYVIRETLVDDCGCGSYLKSLYRVEDDCGCQEAFLPGERVRLRYDRFGNPWIMAVEDAGCGCVDTDFAFSADCGPRYGFREPYRGVYLADRQGKSVKVEEKKDEEKQEEKQGGACTE